MSSSYVETQGQGRRQEDGAARSAAAPASGAIVGGIAGGGEGRGDRRRRRRRDRRRRGVRSGEEHLQLPAETRLQFPAERRRQRPAVTLRLRHSGARPDIAGGPRIEPPRAARTCFTRRIFIYRRAGGRAVMARPVLWSKRLSTSRTFHSAGAVVHRHARSNRHGPCSHREKSYAARHGRPPV